MRSELGAKGRRAENPERDFRTGAGNSLYALAGLDIVEPGLQLDNLLGEPVLAADQCAAQGVRNGLVPARRASEPEISVPNCSATMIGAWLGSMIPPAPRRMRSVSCPACAIITAVAALAMPGMLWCSASQ